MTAIADEFGGAIPCDAYARIGGHAIGEEILRSIGDSPAILMGQHGVFTIGATIEKAIKAAVMVQDVARTVAIAKTIGTVTDLPGEEIAAHHDRYTTRYGQHRNDVMTYDLTTFGEAQIRLTVPKGERLSTCPNLRMTPAGSEANVAGLLAELGNHTAFASVIPAIDPGIRFMQEYRSVGVDLSHVVRTADDRIALYSMEPGDPPIARPRHLRPDAHPLPRHHPRHLRLAGPAGHQGAVRDRHHRRPHQQHGHYGRPCRTRSPRPRRQGCPGRQLPRHAVDVNYRAMLWTPHYARYGLAEVVSTDSVHGVYYVGTGGEQGYTVESVPVVDRPGAGDSFVGGCLHGYLHGDITAGIGYGLRTSKFALTHHGDLTHISPSELDIPTTTDIMR